MTEKTFAVEIVDDTSRRDCDADCGTDWSSPEMVVLAGKQVEQRFGGAATVEYRDLACGELDAGQLEMKRHIRQQGLSVPLLLVNGRLRVAGQFDIRRIVDAIEVEMEIGQ
jgi:hypothetical protein